MSTFVYQTSASPSPCESPSYSLKSRPLAPFLRSARWHIGFNCSELSRSPGFLWRPCMYVHTQFNWIIFPRPSVLRHCNYSTSQRIKKEEGQLSLPCRSQKDQSPRARTAAQREFCSQDDLGPASFCSPFGPHESPRISLLFPRRVEAGSSVEGT